MDYLWEDQYQGAMNIRYNIRRSGERTASVRLVLSHHGKIFRRGLGISVDPRAWSTARQRSGSPKTDARLREIRLELESRLDDYSSEREVNRALDEILESKVGVSPTRGKKVAERGDFTASFDEWSMIPCRTQRYRRNVYNKVNELMGGDISFRDIDETWINELTERMRERGYAQNYEAVVVQKLRTFLRYAYLKGLTTRKLFEGFRPSWRTADTIYLTEEEVERLWTVSLDGRDAMARDLFILGVFTAARYQDYSRLTKENVRDGQIEFVQPKTGGKVIIPASPKVLDILGRYGGRAPSMTQQELNRRIKGICKGIGMTEMVETSLTRGGTTEVERRHRYEMVSSHTARRTGATLLYLSGVPMRQCMMLTGHTTEGNFMKYIRVTKEQNARMLSSNPFFR